MLCQPPPQNVSRWQRRLINLSCLMRVRLSPSQPPRLLSLEEVTSEHAGQLRARAPGL